MVLRVLFSCTKENAGVIRIDRVAEPGSFCVIVAVVEGSPAEASIMKVVNVVIGPNFRFVLLVRFAAADSWY